MNINFKDQIAYKNTKHNLRSKNKDKYQCVIEIALQITYVFLNTLNNIGNNFSFLRMEFGEINRHIYTET